MNRFWAFQVAGWSAYAIAMILSRLGLFPLDLRQMMPAGGAVLTARDIHR